MFNELATTCQDELNLNLYDLSTETQLQTILDVSKVYETLTTESNRDNIPKFEYLGRKLCYIVHVNIFLLQLWRGPDRGNRVFKPEETLENPE